MKQIFFLILCSMVLATDTVLARTVEIEVHGMTCAFCVDTLQRKFEKMASVESFQVSLKTKLIRLETDENLPTIESIEKAILDAGFTPTKITVWE